MQYVVWRTSTPTLVSAFKTLLQEWTFVLEFCPLNFLVKSSCIFCKYFHRLVFFWLTPEINFNLHIQQLIIVKQNKEQKSSILAILLHTVQFSYLNVKQNISLEWLILKTDFVQPGHPQYCSLRWLAVVPLFTL